MARSLKISRFSISGEFRSVLDSDATRKELQRAFAQMDRMHRHLAIGSCCEWMLPQLLDEYMDLRLKYIRIMEDADKVKKLLGGK